MATMTFKINDSSTGGINPSVWVTIRENLDGTLSFNLVQQGGVVGDLRGLFFDLADESILNSLIVTAASSDIRIGDDSIKDLGDGANMNGLLGTDKGYDVGIEIGTAGIGKDDVQSYSFTLDSTARDLTLQDFSKVDFGARLTSVGTIGGSRTDSSKILENTSEAIALSDTQFSAEENAQVEANVLSDINVAGTTVVTGWSGGEVGAQVALASEGDIIGTLQLNADGSYELDTSSADELSAGETIVFNLNYSAKNQDEATSWSTDNAGFTVTVSGKNDGPAASDDVSASGENAQSSGTVLLNDSDVDRLDVIAVDAWTGGELGAAAAIDDGAGATFQLNADGSYVLDTSAADALSEGETVVQTFSYTLADNHGGTDTATISVTINGANDGPEAQDDAAGSITESGSVSGNVGANDRDIDRLDTHTWSLVQGSFNGLGNLSFNADGTWSYAANGAYDSLNDGQSVDLSFSYLMADNHGASDSATVSFSVAGVGSVTPPPNDTDQGGGDGGDDGDDGGEVNESETYQFNNNGFVETKTNELSGFDDNDVVKLDGFGHDVTSIVVSTGNFGLGDADIDDTQINITEQWGNVSNPKTEITDAYLVDYVMTESQAKEQIAVTGFSGEIEYAAEESVTIVGTADAGVVAVSAI